jgi:hypothetical protein
METAIMERRTMRPRRESVWKAYDDERMCVRQAREMSLMEGVFSV